METKPIVTCHGDMPLFASLQDTVLRDLPKESCEWRRSYGRKPRTVNLQASFVPYDADILPDETTKTLVSKPYFHIYWTDCDLETYKQSVKDDIGEWYGALKDASINDWLIVVVIHDESKVKSKLLPRSSVIDKVRNDFCGKQSDRCIVLSDPLKTDQKSSRSGFFQRLRQLLLQAFNHHLDKYEDKMRSLREKRNEPGWNYFDYFIFQEELAFMFEMLGLYEDALIQYDELDALFTQFVENHASGDLVEWLTPCTRPCRKWAGLSLSKAIDLERRQLIKENQVSLLEFRNYLFARQSALIFLLKKGWEVAHRAMDFLYNTAQEINILEIEVPKGALSCWMYMSCLEILKYCETTSEYSLYTATLRDYARTKLKDLGYLCGLMPGTAPTSEQLSHIVDLSGGMGDSIINDSKDDSISPRDKLREAISSEVSFKKHYLEMCELTMGTYKHISRFRSARILGRDMAEFYMKIGEPQKAEGFLLDAIKMYQQESWENLADGTMLDLAKCLYMMNENNKYMKTSCHIASSCCLKYEDRCKYFQEVLRLSSEDIECPYQLRASSVFILEEATLSDSSVILYHDIKVKLIIYSQFPQPITCNTISISVMKSNEGGLSLMKRKSHIRNPSLTFKKHEHLPNFRPIKKQLPAEIDANAAYDKRNGKIVSCSVSCANAHELLKRTDSSSSGTLDTDIIVKGDYSLSLTSKNVEIQPGENTVHLSMKVEEKGIFKLSQICYQINQLEFLKTLSNCDLLFEVVCNEPSIHLKPCKLDKFLAGLQQDVILVINTGSYCIPEGTTLSLEFNAPVAVITDRGDNSVKLPAINSQQIVEYKLRLFMETKQQTSAITETQMTCKIDCWERLLNFNITFHHPFHVTHTLHTSKEKKYLQMKVCGNVKTELNIVRPELSCLNCLDLELIPYNKLAQQWKVSCDQSSTFLWLIKPNISDLPNLDLCFNLQYTSSVDKSGEQRLFSYMCHLEQFQTQYIVSYKVTTEEKTCTTSTPAVLTINVRKASTCTKQDHRLVYQVQSDSSTWALNGKCVGMFNLNDGEFETKLDVIPIKAGLLHMPLVKIYKYVEETENQIEVWIRKPSESDDIDVKTKKETLRFTPLNTGEVYNNSKCQQINVYPSRTSVDTELIVLQ